MKAAKYSLVLLMFLIGFKHSVSAGNRQNSEKPNIVFILADDLTFRDIGCYGSKNVKTPNIDAIAEEGIKFNYCFQAAPMCSPTRHNIYTGIYPVKSGAYPQNTFVKEGIQSVVHYLQEQGYRVALSGKSHVAPREAFPFEILGRPGGDPDLALLEDFIERDKNQPFCAFVCYKEPHTPWTKGDPGIYNPETIELPPYLVDTKETRETIITYYAEINDLDHSVGKIRSLIDALGIGNNTLLIFASEQGNAFPFAKWTCYDSGLQSAFIAKWPGVIKAGSVTDAMIEYVDITPTLCDIAGANRDEKLDGKSFLGVLLGETDRHKEYVFGIQTTKGISNGTVYGVRSIRSARFKYILNIHHNSKFQNNVTEQKNASWTLFWKTWEEKGKTDENAQMLVHKFQHRQEIEFYDIVSDPYELNNLAGDPEYRQEMEKMGKLLHEWMKDQGDMGHQTELDAPLHQLVTKS